MNTETKAVASVKGAAGRAGGRQKVATEPGDEQRGGDRKSHGGWLRQEGVGEYSPERGKNIQGPSRGRGRPDQDYWLSLDMAKELATLERTEARPGSAHAPAATQAIVHALGQRAQSGWLLNVLGVIV